MAQFLTLSRAARLLGVSRGALQKDIRAGKLTTFEGMIEMSDLRRCYPSAVIDDTTEIERMESIKDNAFAKRGRDNLPTDVQVLSERLEAMQRQLDGEIARANWYERVLEDMAEKLGELAGAGCEEEQVLLASLRTWLAQRLEAER